ncbi:tripartite tricarboxylate transporter TctB family protein [Sutterella sp.]|uniref:tripartite tricarboxylate transporter TctB family protein n=1 Tax=Sutterella sp. TaxID=1981025 RepID=UPI0026E0CDD2|nr:tripartite tricarboxylate transporter TctB family protein [Sutterella sp.]MDO5531308.1 tripartite tricarboxylate transporter TctB family protein [Sutterella sp.]
MIKNQKDFAAGLFYIAIGLFGATTLGENELGSLARMGPGYFPFIISVALMLTGLVIAVKAMMTSPVSAAEGHIEWGKPLAPLLILGSAAFYALTLLTLGFVLSIGLMVIISSMAHPLFRLRDALISAVILTTLSAALFIGGLGLIVPLWPTFL